MGDCNLLLNWTEGRKKNVILVVGIRNVEPEFVELVKSIVMID